MRSEWSPALSLRDVAEQAVLGVSQPTTGHHTLGDALCEVPHSWSHPLRAIVHLSTQR